MAWKVPPQTLSCCRQRGRVLHRSRYAEPASAGDRSAASTRRSISAAARRVKVSSRIRPGSTPWAISQATRWTSVAVLPGAGPGHDQQRPIAVRGRLALLRVELGEQFVDSRCSSGIERLRA